MTLFTGSSKVAEKLAVDLKGRIKLEDAGFDWKILGPDVNEVSVVSYKYYLLSTIIFFVDQS
jgi:1-pyrroline-5-carboxylate dehydrogenase